VKTKDFKFLIRLNLFHIFLIIVILPSTANAQVEYQDIKEFNTLYSFENIAFAWKGDAKIQLLLNDGINNLNERKLAEAISSFEELLNKNPNFPIALYYRGICYRLQNDLIRAKGDFTKLIELRDDLPQAYLEMSKVKVMVGYNNEAVQFLTTCIKKFPTYVSAYYLMGENYLRTKDIEKAKSYFDTCQKIAPAFLPAKVKLGLLEIATDHSAQSGLKFFTEVIQTDSLQKEALWCRATMCFKSDPQKKIHDFNTLVRHNPANSYFLLQRGLARVELGDMDGAWSDFRIISNIPIGEQTNASASVNRFIGIQNLRNYLTRVIYGLDQEDQLMYKKSFCLMVAGNYQAADIVLQNAHTKKNAVWHYVSGILSQNLGLTYGAQEHFASTLKFDNDIFDVHQIVGAYLLQTNDLNNAIRHFDEMIRISPSNKSGYTLRAIVNYKLKNYSLSIEDSNKSLEIDNHDCSAKRILGFSYLATDKILQAFDALVQCNSYEIHNFDFLKFHASVKALLNAGDTVKALFYLNKMTDIVPLYETGTHLKIDILAAQKKWKELQYFLKERVQRLALRNSKEYKEYINEELMRVENRLREIEKG
jgi:tetratricopeptide (TPR) repeat protein